MTGTVLRHPARLVRFIELRQVNAGDRWQGIFVGDKHTPPFITTVGPRWLVLDSFRYLDTCRGLPVVPQEGFYEEVAA